jgi:hypothetical protein
MAWTFPINFAKIPIVHKCWKLNYQVRYLCSCTVPAVSAKKIRIKTRIFWTVGRTTNNSDYSRPQNPTHIYFWHLIGTVFIYLFINALISFLKRVSSEMQQCQDRARKIGTGKISFWNLKVRHHERSIKPVSSVLTTIEVNLLVEFTNPANDGLRTLI